MDNWAAPKIEHLKMTRWMWVVAYPNMFKLGKGVDIGIFSFFQAKNGITIGDNCKIGSHCAFFSEDTIGNHKGPITLKEGCKIGTHSTILPNVIIGKNIVIPAYSFIKKSILNEQDLKQFYIANGKDYPKQTKAEKEFLESQL